MSRPTHKTVSTWECPKCDFWYHSPIKGTLAVYHPCKVTFPDLQGCKKRGA